MAGGYALGWLMLLAWLAHWWLTAAPAAGPAGLLSSLLAAAFSPGISQPGLLSQRKAAGAAPLPHQAARSSQAARAAAPAAAAAPLPAPSGTAGLGYQAGQAGPSHFPSSAAASTGSAGLWAQVRTAAGVLACTWPTLLLHEVIAPALVAVPALLLTRGSPGLWLLLRGLWVVMLHCTSPAARMPALGAGVQLGMAEARDRQQLHQRCSEATMQAGGEVASPLKKAGVLPCQPLMPQGQGPPASPTPQKQRVGAHKQGMNLNASSGAPASPQASPPPRAWPAHQENACAMGPQRPHIISPYMAAQSSPTASVQPGASAAATCDQGLGWEGAEGAFAGARCGWWGLVCGTALPLATGALPYLGRSLVAWAWYALAMVAALLVAWASNKSTVKRWR